MDYFGWVARKNKPRPIRQPDPPQPRRERPEPPMEVSEGDLSDTFVGRVKRFWENRG